MQRGDLAVCYLAGAKRIFAVVEVVSDPENDPTRTRWSWRFALRPLLVVDPLDGPPVEAAGVLPRSLGRHSYIRLTREQFEAARTAIAGVSLPAGAGSGRDGHAHAGRASLREG